MILLMELSLLFSGALSEDIHLNSSLSLRLLLFLIALDALELKNSPFDTSFVDLLLCHNVSVSRVDGLTRLGLAPSVAGNIMELSRDLLLRNVLDGVEYLRFCMFV